MERERETEAVLDGFKIPCNWLGHKTFKRQLELEFRRLNGMI